MTNETLLSPKGLYAESSKFECHKGFMPREGFWHYSTLLLQIKAVDFQSMFPNIKIALFAKPKIKGK